MIYAFALIVLAAFVALAMLPSINYTREAEQRWPKLGRMIVVDKVPLHVIERGNGPPILLLHGASANAREFLPTVVPALEQDHRLILVDRPGCGYSGRPPRAEKLEVQAKLMAGLLEEMKTGPVIVIGHSLGGAVALRLALDYPKLVRGLVLAAPACSPYPTDNAWHTKLAASPLAGPVFARLGPPLVGPLMLTAAAKNTFAPADVPHDYVENAGIGLLFRPRAFRANARDVAATKREFEAQHKRYEDIHIPVTIVTADKDRVISPKRHAQALAKALPNAEIITLPGAGHMPHHLRPDVIANAVRRLSALAEAS